MKSSTFEKSASLGRKWWPMYSNCKSNLHSTWDSRMFRRYMLLERDVEYVLCIKNRTHIFESGQASFQINICICIHIVLKKISTRMKLECYAIEEQSSIKNIELKCLGQFFWKKSILMYSWVRKKKSCCVYLLISSLWSSYIYFCTKVSELKSL